MKRQGAPPEEMPLTSELYICCHIRKVDVGEDEEDSQQKKNGLSA